MKDDWRHHQPPGPEGYDYDAGTGGYLPPPGYDSPPGYGVSPGYGPPPPAFSPSPGYGTPPGYGVPPGYGAPYPEPPGQASTIVALVMSILMVTSCCNVLAIPGIVFSAIALSEKRDHGRAARFRNYAWITNALSVVLVVLFFVVMIAVDTA
ncbi:DUF4190 domain-containing protein [Nocardiopsis sp. FIRDI 009]|uniref:DUF4190 domain-containing protein n=1 Tax=Nocardiopsis sp. FIRDI 009 TaxID=714197 RepID=UPI000E255089|nr:DUF4190 domain-containing protein [Nocardiopsis sp. FIRDI 009]